VLGCTCHHDGGAKLNKTERNKMINTNTMKPEDIRATIDKLTEQHNAWNEGAYKTSNTELYQLLSDCLDFYNVVSASVEQRKELYTLLENRGIKFNKNSDLTTRIVRAVFGDCGKRAYAYARVITVAAETKPENETMHTFITNAGGVEQIRRKVNGETPAQKRKSLKDFAENLFAKSDPIVSETVIAASDLLPSKNASNLFSLALIRQNDDGTNSIVYGTNNVTLVDAVLADAGKAERAEKEKQRELELERLRSNDNEKAVNEICEAA